jgi:hypothetical protein
MDATFLIIRFSYCEQKAKFVSMEAKIMSGVPGWEAGKSVYHSERFISRHSFFVLFDLMHYCTWQMGPLLRGFTTS